MSVASDFRDFISRGNVVDLAVGVIIGGAFGKIVTSLVNDIIMPPIGLILSGIDFSALKLVLRAADPAHKRAEVVIAYGAFTNTVIEFLIIAAVIFMLVRAVSALRREETAAPAPARPWPRPAARSCWRRSGTCLPPPGRSAQSPRRRPHALSRPRGRLSPEFRRSGQDLWALLRRGGRRGS